MIPSVLFPTESEWCTLFIASQLLCYCRAKFQYWGRVKRISVLSNQNRDTDVGRSPNSAELPFLYENIYWFWFFWKNLQRKSGGSQTYLWIKYNDQRLSFGLNGWLGECLIENPSASWCCNSTSYSINIWAIVTELC